MLVFVEDPAQALASSYVRVGDLVQVDDRRRQRPQWAGIGDALMGAMPVIETFELPQSVQQVALIPDQDPVQQLTTAVCAHRSMIEFIRGIRTPLSTTSIPASANTASNNSGNLPSRSRIKNRARHPAS